MLTLEQMPAYHAMTQIAMNAALLELDHALPVTKVTLLTVSVSVMAFVNLDARITRNVLTSTFVLAMMDSITSVSAVRPGLHHAILHISKRILRLNLMTESVKN